MVQMCKFFFLIIYRWPNPKPQTLYVTRRSDLGIHFTHPCRSLDAAVSFFWRKKGVFLMQTLVFSGFMATSFHEV